MAGEQQETLLNQQPATKIKYCRNFELEQPMDDYT